MRIVALTVAALLLTATLAATSPWAHGPCSHHTEAHDHHHAHACAHSHHAGSDNTVDGSSAERCPLMPVDSCSGCGAPGCGCGPELPDPIEPIPAGLSQALVETTATGETCPCPAWRLPARPLSSPPPRVGIVVMRT